MIPAGRQSLRELLPPAFETFAGMLDDAQLLRLLNAHGGQRVWIPFTPAAGQMLEELLGLETVQRVALDFGAGQMTVPICKSWRMHILREDGLTYAQIAHRLGMTEQAVYLVLRPGHPPRRKDAEAQLRFKF